MEPKIIFEDRYILVIDKPSGMVVNRSETVERLTVQDWMEQKLQVTSCKLQVNAEFCSRSGMVHRLDKETSGVMVLAKTPASFESLKGQFKTRKVQKEYLALVHGRLSPQRGNINLPIARNPRNRMRFTAKVGGKKALTFYEVESYLFCKDRAGTVLDIGEDRTFSLVKARPRTGRTHQIRVHFSFIGHPIVSDHLYLSRKKLESDLKWCPRLFLHARYLAFSHPRTGKRVKFEAKLPKDLKKAISHVLSGRPILGR